MDSSSSSNNALDDDYNNDLSDKLENFSNKNDTSNDSSSNTSSDTLSVLAVETIENNEILSNASNNDEDESHEDNIIFNSDIKEEEVKQIALADYEEEKIITTFSNSNSSCKTKIFDPRNNSTMNANVNMSTSSSDAISNAFGDIINTQFYEKDKQWREEETKELFNSAIKDINDFIDVNYKSELDQNQSQDFKYKISKHLRGGISRKNTLNKLCVYNSKDESGLFLFVETECNEIICEIYTNSFDVKFIPSISSLLQIATHIYFFNFCDLSSSDFKKVWNGLIRSLRDKKYESNLKSIIFVPFFKISRSGKMLYKNNFEDIYHCAKETSKWKSKVTLVFHMFEFDDTSALEKLLKCIHSNNIKLFLCKINLTTPFNNSNDDIRKSTIHIDQCEILINNK